MGCVSERLLFCVYKFTKYKDKHGSKKFRIFNEKYTDSTETALLKSMMEKVESFITKLRWKTHFFDKKERPWTVFTLALNQILHPYSMIYCHRSKVSYTI